MCTSPNPAKGFLSLIPLPTEIVAHLDRSIVGQTAAKRTLPVVLSNHLVRLLDTMGRNSADPIVTDASLRHITIEKSNVLLINLSGSGKTHLLGQRGNTAGRVGFLRPPGPITPLTANDTTGGMVIRPSWAARIMRPRGQRRGDEPAE
jgi:hypothetical protein